MTHDQHDDSDQDKDKRDEQPTAPYSTSPMQIDEHTGVQRVDSTYGGTEHQNDEQTGSGYGQEKSSAASQNRPDSMGTAEQGLGLSSGAGQTEAGYQAGSDEEPPDEPPTDQEGASRKARRNRPSYQGPEDRRI